MNDPIETSVESGNTTKGTTVRGIVEVLTRDGLLSQVVAMVPPRTHALLVDPPGSSSWINSADIEPVFDALYRLRGYGKCRRVMREASLATQVPLMMSLIKGMIRLFGSSPHTIYSRFPDSIRLTNRGVEVEYERRSANACRVRLRYRGRTNLSVAALHGVAGGLEITLGICNAVGRVSDPKLTSSGRDGIVEFEIDWG